MGTPVHDSIRAAAALAPPSLACDVLLDHQQRVTEVFAGESFSMHERTRAQARREAMHAVRGPFDVVLTTNAEYPLDQNLYQCVKGMAAAERVVSPGGVIVLAAQCSDGLPEHGSYAALLAQATDPARLLALFDDPAMAAPDQWQVQAQARARVLVHCDGLTDAQLRAAHLEPVSDVAGAMEQALPAAGPTARACVLPEGPRTIPYLAGG